MSEQAHSPPTSAAFRPGRPPEIDAAILHLYSGLKALLARQDLDPATRANLAEALVAVSLVVQDLALDYEMLYDLQV